MSVNATNGVTAAQETYAGYGTSIKQTETVKTSEETSVVYEKSTESEEKKATYSITKMSEDERAALVQELKAEQQSRQEQFHNIVRQMMSGQSSAFAISNNIWKFLASGNYEVDAETRAQAQADIAEDGYYGVKQTSERLFDFALALSGGDEEKMKEMHDALLKGFKEATAAWGKDLPDICKETLEATEKLFEDYAKDK